VGQRVHDDRDRDPALRAGDSGHDPTDTRGTAAGRPLFWRAARDYPRARVFWLLGVAISLAGNCVPFCLISFGQQRVDSSLTGILMGIMPLTTMVLAHFFVRGERLNPT
jgi:drug/metabolite transporter (DMT)-like permease